MQAHRWIKFGLIAVAPPAIYFSIYLIALAGWSANVSLVAFCGLHTFGFLTQPWLSLCGGGHEMLAVLIALVQYGLIGVALAFFSHWRACARARTQGNFCPKCHYDRTGLPGGADAVCPECGTGSKTA